MLRTLTLFLFSGILSFLNAQSFTDFINYLNSVPSSSRQAAVDSFMNVPRSYPVTESTRAHFIYFGTASTAAVAGDFNGWDYSKGPMTNAAGTTLWYRTENFPSDARMDYKLVIGGSWILDPRNSHTVAGGYGPNSELAMPAYVQPWEIRYRDNIKHGTIVQTSILSNIVKRTYQLSIYLPPAYVAETSKRFPSVYFQDGSEYQNLGSAVNILDNLIDSSKIEQVIAVFVRPNDRNDEYAYNNRHNYRQFFVKELVPFIDSLYRTINRADKRLVLGDSFGGNISALISWYHPDVFGNCGQQSGAFWPNNYEASTMLFKSEYKNIKIHSVWGSYEGELTRDWRMGVDSLKSKEYKFSAKERPEGHSWGLWRANLDDMLIYFFPYNSSSDVTDINLSPSSFHLQQNYPNPFNPETIISYNLTKDSHVDLSIYDLLGNKIAALVNGRQNPGSYKVRFSASGLSSGIYMYRLKTDFESVTRKMSLIR